jgi:alpha-mannosidase
MIFSGKLLLFLLAIPLASAQTLWQIGKFDQSPVEFSSNPHGAVYFRTESSHAQNEWPAKQATGEVFKIAFAVAHPTGTYRLRIAALIDEPRVPALQIDVNGQAGKFYLHPKLSYSRSDFSYAFDPHESQSSLDIEVPASMLKDGENVLSITCVDDPATPSTEKELGGISYDALSFEQQAGAPTKTAQMRAEPTIFFRGTDGQLTEVVDAFLRFAKPWNAGEADLEVNGKHFRANYPAGKFGEVRMSFDVPEWSGAIQGQLKAGGNTKGSTNVTLAAQRKWNVFVVPHTHLDVGYTDYQGKVAETQARVLTQAGELIKQNPDFRFSMDGSWNLQQLLETRPEAKREEILNLIRSGKMAMPAQWCNLLTGYASLETLYRSLYDSREFARRYNLPFEYANITDVPTYSGSYPSILAGSGIKYWVAAANNDRAPIFYYDQWNEKSPFWWEGPDGKKILFWYSRHYMQVQTLFGLSPQLPAVRESLPIFLQAYSKPTYKPDVALIYGIQVENTDLVPSTATFATVWNKQYAYPKLTYSTFPDFFHRVEKQFGAQLPTVKGDGSGYWEDGIGSDAYFAAEDRSNQNRALSAEILASATHSVDANLNPPAGAFNDIWHNIALFAEHTWLSYNSVSQPDHDESIRQLKVKDGRAEAAALEIEDVTNRSLSQLADQIHIPANTLVVFNSLNWKRSGLVETDLLEGSRLADIATGKEIPVQVLYKKEKFLRVRFLAENVPPVGYRCFAIQTRGTSPEETSKTPQSKVENRFYRLVLDSESGAIESIYDKELNRELVDAKSPYKFGQYLYVTGGDGDTQMINPFPALPPGELAVHPAGHGKLLGVETMPWGKSIRLMSSAPMTPSIETEILLFDDTKKIDIRYRVHKDYTNNKEGVYLAFPVAVQNPQFRFAAQQGWLDPAHDLMKGGSLEWFNVQQWMSVHDADLSVGIVPLDASLASFGDINRGKWPGEFQPKSSTIFSYVMNNYWHTNYRAGQGGDFTFRYTVTSDAQFDGGALTKLGMTEQRPFETDYVVSQDKVGNPQRPLPAEGASFLELSNPAVGLVTWKRAQDGRGSIVRLQELAGRRAETNIRLTKSPISSAHLCTGVEDDVSSLPVNDGAVELSLNPFEVVTVRMENN